MKDQKIVVTGASRGLGAAIALRLASSGNQVFAWARSQGQLAEIAAQDPTGHIVPMQVDVTAVEQIEAAYQTIEQEHGPISVLINNAAVVQRDHFWKQPLEVMDQMIDINLKGTMYCTRLLLPYMLPRQSGRIINVSSVAGTRGIELQAAYCASKHGVVGFADALAQELLPHGIVMSTICPGAIDTPLWNEQTNPYPGDLANVMQPEELAELIEFLLNQPARTMYKRLVMFPTNEWH